jgi:hypothetical protein
LRHPAEDRGRLSLIAAIRQEVLGDVSSKGCIVDKIREFKATLNDPS